MPNKIIICSDWNDNYYNNNTVTISIMSCFFYGMEP